MLWICPIWIRPKCWRVHFIWTGYKGGGPPPLWYQKMNKKLQKIFCTHYLLYFFPKSISLCLEMRPGFLQQKKHLRSPLLIQNSNHYWVNSKPQFFFCHRKNIFFNPSKENNFVLEEKEISWSLPFWETMRYQPTEMHRRPLGAKNYGSKRERI